MSAKKVSNGRPAERANGTNGKPKPSTPAPGKPAPAAPAPGKPGGYLSPVGEQFLLPNGETVGFRELCRRTEAGDENAAAAFRAVLAWPGWANAAGGNLALHLQERIIDSFNFLPPLQREGIRVKVEQLRAELGGPEPAALETLLVDRIVVTWLKLYYFESAYLIKSKDGLPPDEHAFWERCIAAAHKRHLSAIKALAQVRKLALPALVLAVAEQQVNEFRVGGVEINAGPKPKRKRRGIGGPALPAPAEERL